MLSSKYEPLKQEVSEESSEYGGFQHTVHSSSARVWKLIYSISALLLISITSNAMLFVQLRNTQIRTDAQSYVGLRKDLPIPIPHDDRTIDDPMWDEPEIDYFNGFVALSDAFVAEKGLPSAMRYPWDKSKSIYVFHSYHSLHCVFVLREAIMQWHDNQTQSWEYSHVTHCLHVLREDTMCNADDTPRYTGALHAQKGLIDGLSSGLGQVRMCRDWSKLHKFAVENSACYRRPLDHPISLLDRYKSCPDGSKPWEKVD